MREIAFRPLGADDMQSMFLWLLRPHVARWYSKPPGSFHEVVARYGPRTKPESPVRAFVILIDGREAGYIQSYPVEIFPEYARRMDCGPGVVGLDLFIGDEMFLGWGLGSRAIRQFADQIVFTQPGVGACVAGPVEGNAASIRAFEKAGFARWKTLDNERGDRECVMRRESEGGPSPVARPAAKPALPMRLARASDAARILEIYAPNVEETFISFELEAPTVDEMRARIDKTLRTYPWIVAERDGVIVGYAYASQHRDRLAYQWSVDVACYVHPAARGQGVGANLYRLLLRVLERQGFHGAYGGIALPNSASVRLHESVGFTKVGEYREVGYKMGAWRDTVWMECRIGAARADPPMPTPLRELGPGILDQL
jgi:L-amino acid N-acyltransferase YncA